MTANVEVGVVDGTMGMLLVGNNLANVLIGNTGDDLLWGGDGNDKLFGMAGHDELRGDAGNDEYYLADVIETAPGQWDWDEVIEDTGIASGIDTVFIQAASTSNPLLVRNDYVLPDLIENGIVETDIGFSLTGNEMDNVLAGNTGPDQIAGVAGFDILLGFGGRDILYGDGPGASGFADIFRFTALSDSAPGVANRDVIMDFEPGRMTSEGAVIVDRIDLSGIDANSKAKNDQAFNFIGEAEFSSDRRNKVYGELRVDNDEGFSILQADVNGDGRADFEIAFNGTFNFTTNDFLL